MDTRPDDHDRPGLSHDLPCGHCGHPAHRFEVCDLCDCKPYVAV